eukprot:GHUV01055364.1.p1 GENE.GHUV01055364.1~~GHUV01055364.1.p1  ORF type:complete len:228 (+),score=79.21 GHUV01055364.1:2242-2925(+)
MALVIIGGTVLDIQARHCSSSVLCCSSSTSEMGRSCHKHCNQAHRLLVQAQAADADLMRGSSVPGKVSQVAGGVGRNIAEAAHHLLHRQPQRAHRPSQVLAVHLISILGCDAAADALMASFQQLGMHMSGIIHSGNCSTASVVTLLDRTGEVAASVADVAAAAYITPGVVQQHASAIQQAQLLILDANFDAATLAAAAEIAAAAGVPVLFEPVSIPKSVRCVGQLLQ